MRFKAAVVIIILAAFSSARADMFDATYVPETEKLTLSFVYKGIDVAKPPDKPYSIRFTAAEASVEAVYFTRMVGDGTNRHAEVEIKSRANNGYKALQLIKFVPGKKLILSSFERSVFAPSGKKIRVENYDFSESVPPLPEEMTHPYTFPLVARGLDFTPGKERKFYIWFNPTMIFMMKVLVKGTEDVTVPAGKFKCHRLEMGPDLLDFAGPILGRALKPLVASYTAWLDANPPYRIVRYQGPFGMVNIAGPSEIYELVSYE